MRRIALVLLVASCSKGKPDDCAVVRETPAQAMAELSKRYPNNPVKVAQTIENCVAPSGEECDRLGKILIAIPTMAPQLAMPSGVGSAADAARICETSPPQFRRCLLPSYALAHADECREVITQPITKFEIKPSTKRTADEDCGFVAIYIDKQGTWLATGRDPKSRCFAPRKAGELDHEWLEMQLRNVKTLDCAPSAAELAAAGEARYQEMIATMDVAVKVGFIDTGVSAPAELTVPLATASIQGAARDCPAGTIAAEPAAEPPSRPMARDPMIRPGSDQVSKAPVVIITKSALSLRGSEIMTLADAQAATKLDALAKALPPTRDGLLILQADESTPTIVINRVIQTVKTAGYDNILFAVKNK